MGLGTTIFKKELKIKNGTAYAFTKETGKLEKINGCEYFKNLVERDVNISAEIISLQKQIEALEIEKQENKSERLNLELANYCPLDEKIFTRMGGVVTSTELGHRRNCKHKGEQ